MKLIIIHGPPAAGKHTVGQKLAELTNYKFFYNHLTVDVVRTFFNDNDPSRHALLSRLRVDSIEAAAKHNLDTIFTMAYTEDEPSRQFLEEVKRVVAAHGGVIHFVLLNPPDDTLFERIGNESRSLLRKPTDLDDLRRKLKTKQMRLTLDPATLVLDSSKLTPEELAQQIITHFALL